MGKDMKNDFCIVCSNCGTQSDWSDILKNNADSRIKIEFEANYDFTVDVEVTCKECQNNMFN